MCIALNDLLPCSMRATVDPTGALGFTSPTFKSAVLATLLPASCIAFISWNKVPDGSLKGKGIIALFTSSTVASDDSDGAFPATNTTKIAWTEEVCSHQSVFVFGSDTLRIDRAGLYKFTYNVTLGINNGSNRTEGGVAIIKDPSGSPSVVDGSVTSTYNRFVEGGGLASRSTACATVVINVAVNDVFQIDHAKICDTIDDTKLKTLPEGTSWYVEALS